MASRARTEAACLRDAFKAPTYTFHKIPARDAISDARHGARRPAAWDESRPTSHRDALFAFFRDDAPSLALSFGGTLALLAIVNAAAMWWFA